MARNADTLIRELRDKLRINRHALDDEVEQQAELYHEVADKTVMAKSRKDQLEDEVKQMYAELDVQFRRRAEKNEERITEKEIASRIARHKEYKKLVKASLAARLEYERLDALQTSFRQRSYMVRDLVELHIAGYYQARSMGGSDRRHTDNEVERVKSKLAERRGTRARSRIKKNPNAD